MSMCGVSMEDEVRKGGKMGIGRCGGSFKREKYLKVKNENVITPKNYKAHCPYNAYRIVRNFT